MRWVYLLESIPFPKQHYIGMAEDPDSRLLDHNAGKSRHTSKYKPWKLKVAIRFEDDGRAIAFEQYLKTGSGFSFSQRHFW